MRPAHRQQAKRAESIRTDSGDFVTVERLDQDQENTDVSKAEDGLLDSTRLTQPDNISIGQSAGSHTTPPSCQDPKEQSNAAEDPNTQVKHPTICIAISENGSRCRRPAEKGLWTCARKNHLAQAPEDQGKPPILSAYTPGSTEVEYPIIESTPCLPGPQNQLLSSEHENLDDQKGFLSEIGEHSPQAPDQVSQQQLVELLQELLDYVDRIESSVTGSSQSIARSTTSTRGSQQVNILRQEMLQMFNDFNSKFEILSTRLTCVQGQVGTLQTLAGDQAERLRIIQEQMNPIFARFATVEVDLSTTQGQVEIVEECTATRENLHTTLESRVTSVLQRLLGLEKASDLSNRKLAELEKRGSDSSSPGLGQDNDRGRLSVYITATDTLKQDVSKYKSRLNDFGKKYIEDRSTNQRDLASIRKEIKGSLPVTADISDQFKGFRLTVERSLAALRLSDDRMIEKLRHLEHRLNKSRTMSSASYSSLPAAQSQVPETREEQIEQREQSNSPTHCPGYLHIKSPFSGLRGDERREKIAQLRTELKSKYGLSEGRGQNK